jgi:hypothetical protein
MPKRIDIKTAPPNQSSPGPLGLVNVPSIQPKVSVRAARFQQARTKPEKQVGTTARKGRAKLSNQVVHSHAAEILSQAIKNEYRYATLGLVLGLCAILGGTILALHGIVGHTSWTASLLGFESKINDAAPGAILFIVGIFFVFITKPHVKLGDLKDD